MSDPSETSLIAAPVPRGWLYVVCVLAAFLVVAVANLVPPDASTEPATPAPGVEQTAPAKESPAGQTETINPRTAWILSILSSVAIGAIILSYIWLLCISIRRWGADVFPPIGPRHAYWTVIDVLAMAATFVLLFSALGMVTDGTTGLYVSNSIAKLLVSVAILEMIRRRGQAPRDALGLGSRGLFAPLGLGLAVFLVFIPLLAEIAAVWEFVITDWVPEQVKPQDVVKLFSTTQSNALVAQIILAAVVVAPLAEEIFFRGFLYGLLRRYARPVFAIPAVGLAFGAVHPPLVAMIPMAFLGGLLCYLYERTGRLTVCIIAHALYNLFQTCVIMSLRLS